MKTVTRGWTAKSFRLWGLGLVEAIFFLPAYILVLAYLAPELVQPSTSSWGVLLLGGAMPFAGVLLRGLVPLFWKRIAASVLLGAVYGMALLAATGSEQAGFLFGLPAGAVLAWQGMTVAGRSSPQKLYWWGIALYTLSGVAFARIPNLAAYMPLITAAGVFCLAWTLFHVNRTYLRYSTFSQEKATGSRTLPRGLERYNITWIGLIVAAAVLLAAGAGRWLGEGLLQLLRVVVGWLNRPSPAESPPQTEGGPPPTPFMPAAEEAAEPGWLSQVLDIAFYVLGTGVLLLLLALGVYWLSKHAGDFWRRAVKRLAALLGRRGLPERQTGYVDEEIRLNASKRAGGKLRERRGASFLGLRVGRGERWEELRDNRERVRYLYRRWLRHAQSSGYKPRAHLTPMEQEAEARHLFGRKAASGRFGPEAGKRDPQPDRESRQAATAKLLALYYRARYGEAEPSDEEVSSAKRELDLLRGSGKR